MPLSPASSVKTAFVVRYIGDLSSLQKHSDRELDLFWFHDENRFCYAEGPRTMYETRAEAEGGIIWIIAKKGTDYIGDLEVVEVIDYREPACRG